MKASTSVNKRFRALCLILAAALLAASLTGCRKKPAEPEMTETAPQVTEPQIPAGNITIPYTELDSLNPFYIDTVLNFSLISLVYDSLFYLDGGFMPTPLIAREADAKDLTVRVRLDDALIFSDATPLTSADVVYSFVKAKGAPLYAETLNNVADCEADGAHAVVFTLEEADVNALNTLTFPIVKNGTAEDPEIQPVGSGFYTYKKDALRIYLEYNLRHAGGIPEIGTIRLREVSESATLMHLLNTGAIDCFYADMADGIAKRSYSGASEVYLNNLVFLGVNQGSALLGNADIRKAVSLAVSRISLCENAFQSHARASLTPVNPAWDALKDIPDPENAKFEADLGAADALMATMALGQDGENLFYTLIVQDGSTPMLTAANLIAEQLKLIKIELAVQVLDEEDFAATLAAGEYDFYLSEIKLTKNMDLSPFLIPGGAADWGMDFENLDIGDLYIKYLAGELPLEQFLAAFDETMPFIPLLYRNGQLCYSAAIKSGVTATEDRQFMNIAAWKV